MNNPKGGQSGPDPLAATVDKLLTNLSATSPPSVDPDLMQSPRRPGARPGAGQGALRSKRSPMEDLRRSFWALVGELLLASALAVALPLWPYASDCGFPLLGYMVGVALLLVVGVWGAITAWKIRFGFAHLVALLLVYWGIVLAAEQVLPRIGYAAQAAAWSCGG